MNPLPQDGWSSPRATIDQCSDDEGIEPDYNATRVTTGAPVPPVASSKARRSHTAGLPQSCPRNPGALDPALLALLDDSHTWRESASAAWRYSKAGVILEESPRALFGALDRERSGALMQAMDACNARFGRGAVVPARAGLDEKRNWSTKFEMRSPRFTTRLSEVPVVTAEA